MSEVVQRSVQDVETIATDLGLRALLPLPCELFIDIDNPYTGRQHDIGRLTKCLEDNGIHILSRLSTESKGGNLHLYLRLSVNLTQEERIALQLACGSDSVKEVLSLIRCREQGSEAAIALFETPKAYLQVQRWRAEKVPAVITVAEMFPLDDVVF